MGRSVTIWVLFLLWAGLFAMSAVSALTIAPEGDGFTRGLNRFGAIATWQGVAFLVALVTLFVGGRGETAGLRWLSRAPFLAQLLLVLGVAGLIGYTLWVNPTA